jgi:N-acetylglutamate synthase-like GNAT family acetyltransferase
MAIREAKFGDLNSLLELYKHLHAKDDSLPDRTNLEKIWLEMLSDPRHFIFLLEQGQELISSCVLQVIPNLTRGARPYGLIENVVTRDDSQGQGYGTQVLKHALNLAWKKECYKVMLMTSRDDPRVFSFYEKAGFKKGIKTGFVAKPRI